MHTITSSYPTIFQSQWLAITCLMGVAYKNLSVKSYFSQMRPSRSGFDYECGAFRSDLIVNEFKQIGLMWSIGLLVMNAPLLNHLMWIPGTLGSENRSVVAYTHTWIYNVQHSQAQLESEVRAVARWQRLGDKGIKIKWF